MAMQPRMSLGLSNKPSEPSRAGETAPAIMMSPEALRTAWRRTMGRPMPRHLPHALLVRILVYQRQARQHGGLSRAVLAELKRATAAVAQGEGSSSPTPPPRLLKPGTVLLREHDGAMQQVMVMADGFAWKGQTYASLSKVAFAITGTRWNGPRFFGLRSGTRPQASRS